MDIFDYGILLFSCIVEIYICKEFVTSFYEKRRYNGFMNGRLLDLIGIMLLYSVNLVGNANLNLMITPILLMGYIKVICKVNLVQTIMCFLIVFSALLGGEFVFVVAANVTSLDSGINLSEMPWITFGTKLVSYVILLVIAQNSNKNQKRLNNSIFWMYLLIPTASIGMMLTSFFVAESTITDTAVKIALSVSFLLMLLGNMIVFKAFNKYGEQLQKNLEQSWIISREMMNKEYYAKIEQLNEERQTLIHDLKQYVRTATLLIHQQEYCDAQNILESLGEKISDNEKRIYANHPQIDVILSDRINSVKDKDVCFNVIVEPSINFTKVNMSDYIVMLGNLLDNAIQAVEKCSNKREISASFFTSENNCFIVCKIVNTFNPVYLKEEAGEFISTKREQGVHGLGIKSVRNLANLNGGYLRSKVENGYFVSTLVVPA